MGKRSNFARRPMDDYATPPEAVLPLIPHLRFFGVETFAEPCAGCGQLIRTLAVHGLECVRATEIRVDLVDLVADRIGFGIDALATGREFFREADAIITNPPWTRELLHPLIDHFIQIKPTWLLFDADWMHTRQAAPYLPHCSRIVSVGRVKWMPGSDYTGKDNAAWYRFDAACQTGPRFYGLAANQVEKISMGEAA